MFWLFGQIWIWLIIAFALGAVLAALVSSRIHKRNHQEYSDTQNADAQLESDYTDDFESEPHQNDPYDQKDLASDFSSESASRRSDMINSAEETTVLKAQPERTRWPAEEFHRPAASSRPESTRTSSWPGQEEPEWPTDEDWPDRNHEQRHW